MLERYCNQICLVIAVLSAVIVSLRLEANQNYNDVKNMSGSSYKQCVANEALISSSDDIYECVSTNGDYMVLSCRTKLTEDGNPYYHCGS
ncbi:hypothetical protein [Thalassotalea ganghwensis]